MTSVNAQNTTIHVSSSTTQRTQRTNDYSFTVNDSSGDGMARFQYVYDICTNVAHGCILGLTIYLIILCFIRPVVLFTWHPFFLTIGWVFLMSEGILIFSNSNYLAQRFSSSQQAKLHWMIQTAAGVCIVIGGLMVLINKFKNDGRHFATTHSQWGLATVICGIIGVAVGTYAHLKKFILYKFIHVCLSIIVLVLGTCTLIASFSTHWFQDRGGKFMQVVCIILVLFIVIVISVRPCFSTYKRLKYLLK